MGNPLEISMFIFLLIGMPAGSKSSRVIITGDGCGIITRSSRVCTLHFYLFQMLLSSPYHATTPTNRPPHRNQNHQCIIDGTSLCTCPNLTTPKMAHKKRATIKLGVLLPFSTRDRNAYHSGQYYASAMCIALRDVNRNVSILPNHRIDLVWANTQCDWKWTVKAQYKMLHEENVDAFIGGRCDYIVIGICLKRTAAVRKKIVRFIVLHGPENYCPL